MPIDQFSSATPAIQLLVGILLLFFGRRLFWFFVAVVGFLFGMEFGAGLVAESGTWAVVLVALALGLLGAILAVVLQRIVVIVAGGVAGGLFLMRLAAAAGLGDPLPLVAFVLGAVIAAILAAFLFDWALIALSAVTGASLIVTAFALSSSFAALVWVILLIVGVVVQARFLAPAGTSSARTVP